MRRLLFCLVLLLCSSVFAEKAHDIFTVGQGFGVNIRFSPDGLNMTTTQINAILPYEDGYILKLYGNRGALIEFYAKKGSRLYFDGYNNSVRGNILSLPENGFPDGHKPVGVIEITSIEPNRFEADIWVQ